MRTDPARLADILAAIARIQKYSERGRDSFLQDELLQTWIVHNLQIIGEAVSRVTDTLKKLHPEVQWTQIAAMRNLIIHDYFGVDLDQIWRVAERDIPKLREQVETILKTSNE